MVVEANKSRATAFVGRSGKSDLNINADSQTVAERALRDAKSGSGFTDGRVSHAKCGEGEMGIIVPPPSVRPRRKKLP